SRNQPPSGCAASPSTPIQCPASGLTSSRSAAGTLGERRRGPLGLFVTGVIVTGVVVPVVIVLIVALVLVVALELVVVVVLVRLAGVGRFQRVAGHMHGIDLRLPAGRRPGGERERQAVGVQLAHLHLLGLAR